MLPHPTIADAIADLRERAEANEEVVRLLEANLTLAIDIAKALVADGRDALARLSKVEGELARWRARGEELIRDAEALRKGHS